MTHPACRPILPHAATTTFTDGVTEAIDPQGAFLGNDGLERILQRRTKEPVNELCESVIQDVADFQANNLQDDATFLVIRRNT